MRLNLVTIVLVSTCLPSAADACWEAAGARYGVSPQLLYAIGRVESSLNPQAMNTTHLKRTGTYDIGLMQINSSHLPKLAKFGITESALREPCTNINVGAWILADQFSRRGVSWESVGAYNAACKQLRGEACTRARSEYAWKVYRRLPSQDANLAPPSKKAAGRQQQVSKTAQAAHVEGMRQPGNGEGVTAAHPIILAVRVSR